MKLIPAWRWVLSRAWSLRLIELAALDEGRSRRGKRGQPAANNAAKAREEARIAEIEAENQSLLAPSN